MPDHTYHEVSPSEADPVEDDGTSTFGGLPQTQRYVSQTDFIDESYHRREPRLAFVPMLVCGVLIVFYVFGGMWKTILAMLVGFLFAFAHSNASINFGEITRRMFTDVRLGGQRALLFATAFGTVLCCVIIPKVLPWGLPGLPIVLGSFLFGIASEIADSDLLTLLGKAGSGELKAIIGFFCALLGAGIGVVQWGLWNNLPTLKSPESLSSNQSTAIGVALGFLQSVVLCIAGFSLLVFEKWWRGSSFAVSSSMTARMSSYFTSSRNSGNNRNNANDLGDIRDFDVGSVPTTGFDAFENGDGNVHARTRDVSLSLHPHPDTWLHRLIYGPWSLISGLSLMVFLSFLALLGIGRPVDMSGGLILWATKFGLAFSSSPISSLPYWVASGRLAEYEEWTFLAPETALSFGFLCGSAASAMVHRRFIPERAFPKKMYAATALGSLLLGYSAVIAAGDSVAAMLGGIITTSGWGFVWYLACIPGVYIGSFVRPWIGWDVEVDGGLRIMRRGNQNRDDF